eukprot:CAMPEP_0202502514 /NCGR_PEP_ID=MMETSP1361-20130828/39167_1 /ASSEMBLY_ACC=CAM_ASM_000849 /TAXON_ID=210615 /ORGANISM="Staurosira complex sp., Strain CCMP2646" /LENGTH=206 /DNA_ID=CAMNT_0049135527 /DNA_START=659 /DNA_END=1280 /DNA_ORIENTATION=-
MTGHEALTKLSLKSTGEDSHRSFYHLLDANARSNITLELEQNNNLNHADVIALASSLRRNTRVETLDLAGNNLDGKGAITLANALRVDITLKTIAKFERPAILSAMMVPLPLHKHGQSTQHTVFSLFVSNFSRGGLDVFASYLPLMIGLMSISFIGLELLRDYFSRQCSAATPEGSRAQYGARKRTLFSNTHMFPNNEKDEYRKID